MTAIEANGLSKRYGTLTALDRVDLAVEEGEIFGFLGPNGAGKSTFINLLLDFVRPDAGSVRMFGHDCQAEGVAARERVGVLPEGYSVFDRLTGRQHLEYAIRSKDAGADPVRILDRVGIRAAAERKASDYSKGMKQRLVLGMALAGDPDLLVLDEPSTGIDPNGARRLREIVRTEADRGATVFFSSHVLEQVEAVADTIAILLDGRVAATGEVDALKRQLSVGATLSIDVRDAPDHLLGELRSLDGVREVRRDAGHIEVVCDDDGDVKLEALNAVADAGVYRDFGLREASLSTVFSEYTGPDGDPGSAESSPDAAASETVPDEAGKYLEWSQGDRR